MSLTTASRALLDATASLPGAASLPMVRAIVDARRLVAAALKEAEEMASRGEPARLTRRTGQRAGGGFEPVAPLAEGHYWPLCSGEWAGPEGLRVRLYQRRVGPANCFPIHGSIACRTKVTPPVPALMGWWAVHKADAYLGHILIYRGATMDRPPAAKVREIAERKADHWAK